MGWIIFVAGAVLSWGAYGALLHMGQTQLGNPLKALLCVGAAYFLIGVIVPVIALGSQGSLSNFDTAGLVTATIAGALGAAERGDLGRRAGDVLVGGGEHVGQERRLQRGVLVAQRVEVAGVQDRELDGAVGDGLHHARRLLEHGQLAERHPGGQRGQPSRPGDQQGHLALDEEEQLAPGVALPHDPLACGVAPGPHEDGQPRDSDVPIHRAVRFERLNQGADLGGVGRLDRHRRGF